jgi:hypothetical protein
LAIFYTSLRIMGSKSSSGFYSRTGMVKITMWTLTSSVRPSICASYATANILW